jgi:hypothetical protein
LTGDRSASAVINWNRATASRTARAASTTRTTGAARTGGTRGFHQLLPDLLFDPSDHRIGPRIERLLPINAFVACFGLHGAGYDTGYEFPILVDDEERPA